MSRPSWFEFTTAILGLMRKLASPLSISSPSHSSPANSAIPVPMVTSRCCRKSAPSFRRCIYSASATVEFCMRQATISFHICIRRFLAFLCTIWCQNFHYRAFAMPKTPVGTIPSVYTMPEWLSWHRLEAAYNTARQHGTDGVARNGTTRYVLWCRRWAVGNYWYVCEWLDRRQNLIHFNASSTVLTTQPCVCLGKVSN